MKTLKWRRLLTALLLGAAVSMPAFADAQADYENGRKAYNSGDLITAMQLLGRASDAGHPGAQEALGYILDAAQENKQAFDLYTRSAASGYAPAHFRLAAMYAAGDGIPVDYAKALEHYGHAIDGGHLEAMEVLGIAYLDGHFGLIRDREKGIALLQRAYAGGHDAAKVTLKQYGVEPAEKNPPAAK